MKKPYQAYHSPHTALSIRSDWNVNKCFFQMAKSDFDKCQKVKVVLTLQSNDAITNLSYVYQIVKHNFHNFTAMLF
jgi:hypothetical protein